MSKPCRENGGERVETCHCWRRSQNLGLPLILTCPPGTFWILNFMAFTESFPVHTLVIVPCVLQLLESGHNMCCQCPEGERADLAHLLQTGFSIIFGFEKFSGATVTRLAGDTPARRCLSKVLAVPLSSSFQKLTRTKLC